MEHRCGYRRTAQLRIVVRTMQGVVSEGLLVNLSASGALVVSALPVRVNSQVLVQFRANPPRSTLGSAIRADVIRTTGGGFALEWDEFSAPPIRRLLRELGQQPAFETETAVEENWASLRM